jgi:hypothetical protein
VIQDHAGALIGLLRVASHLVVFPVEDGADGSGSANVPHRTAPPYVSVHVTFGRALGPDPVNPTLDMRSGRATARAYCHCVGRDDVGARAVAQLVEAALLDVRPTIAGRTCFPIRFESAEPPRSDESTGLLVANLTVVYRLDSVPGPTP